MIHIKAFGWHKILLYIFSYRKKKKIKKSLKFLFNSLLLFRQEIINHPYQLSSNIDMSVRQYSPNSQSLIHNYHTIHCPSRLLGLSLNHN